VAAWADEEGIDEETIRERLIKLAAEKAAAQKAAEIGDENIARQSRKRCCCRRSTISGASICDARTSALR
jgi:hypothetical protein